MPGGRSTTSPRAHSLAWWSRQGEWPGAPPLWPEGCWPGLSDLCVFLLPCSLCCLRICWMRSPWWWWSGP